MAEKWDSIKNLIHDKRDIEERLIAAIRTLEERYEVTVNEVQLVHVGTVAREVLTTCSLRIEIDSGAYLS